MTTTTKTAFKNRDSRDLHNHLWDLLERLDNGEATPQHVRAASSIASNLLATSRLQMDYARFVSDARGKNSEHQTLPSIGMGGQH